MDSDPNNWYPEPVPMWNLQTPTIFVPPSPTLVNPPLSPPPHCSLHFIPPFQSPSVPAFIPDPVAVQIIDAFAGFRQTMDECFNDFKVDLGKVQERLHERGRLIKELRSKVSSAVTPPGPQYAPEDPTLPRPWRGLIDGSTGSLYYWNTATNQTQYERPCEQAWITQPEYPPTLPSSEYPVHSNTPPYTPDFPPLTHPTNPHPTQSVYLHRKQLRGFRRRVSMAATRQLFKATRKQNLLSTAGKDSRTQVNRKNGLWAVKAQNGCVFPEIMQELCQLCLEAPTDTSSSLVTSHSPSPVIFSGPAVPERKEVLHSMATSVLADEKPLQPLSVTAVEDGYCEGLFKVIISASDGSCSHSDLSYQTHSHASDATNVEIGISNVVELLVPEAVDKHGFNSGQEDLCSDSSIVQQVTVTDEFYLQESDGSCKPSLLLGDYEMILDEDQMLAVHDQSAVVTSPLFLQLLLGVENVPWQQIVTGAKSNERILTAKFGSGVFEFNFKVTIIPCCNIEFVLELLPGIQLHTDRSIKDQKPGDLEKAQLDLIHCYHNILIASVTPQLTVYGLKTLPLEFESHLNYVINDFDVLGDDYFMLAFLCADCSLCLCANYSIPCSVRISLLSKDMIFDGDLLSAAPCESDIMLNEYYHLNQAKEFNEWAQGLVVELVAQFITSASKVLLPIAIAAEERTAIMIIDILQRAKATVEVVSKEDKYVLLLYPCAVKCFRDAVFSPQFSIAYVTSNLLAIESSVISVIPRCGETKRTDDVFGAINQLHQLSMSPAEWFEKMLVDGDNLLFDNMSASDIKLDSFLPSTGWDSDIDSIDMAHLGNSDIVYEDLLVTSLPLIQVLHPKVFRMANVLEKTGHRMVLEKSAVVMFVNHGNYLTLGIEDGDLGVVEVQKMELDLAELCNQISSQSVVNLLEEVAAIDMGKLRDERFLFPDGFNENYQANSKLYSLSTLQQSGHEAWRVHNIYYMLTLQEGPPSGVHVEIMNYELVQNECQMDQGDCKTLFARASLPLSLTEATELYKGMDISAITQLYSKFLLLWLVHAQHEHSKWSATIYLALIAGCLHVRDHKPKFENMTRLVPEMCSSTINLVKGASGFGLGFSAVMSEEKFIIEFFEILEDMNIEALMSTAYLRRVQFWGFASNKAAYINFLVGPCVNSGDIRSGQKMFDNFSCPNVFSVTDVLPGYHLEVIKLFREMQFWGAKRNQVTLAVELNSSASMGNLKETVTKNYFGNFVNIQPNTDFRSAKRDWMPIDEGQPYCLHGYVDERNQCSLFISSDNAIHKFATTKYYRATVESREKQLKGSIRDTYFGGVLGDAARPQAKLRHDVVQAPPAWLLTATAFLLSTSLIPCALLLAVMQVISTIAAALAEFTSEVYRHINAKISTHVAALTFGSTSLAQVIEDSSALRTSLFLRGWNC